MGKDCPVEWCDSAANPVMGCDGCELWIPGKGIKHCYAGTLHTIRAGRPGYAERFDEPKLFPGRMAAAARWSDLGGTERPEKPWLNSMPRMIFISDMGDALSRDVPFSFLQEEIIAAVTSEPGRRHLWLWPTKQPQRMALFAAHLESQGISWPKNLWAGTSVTSAEQTARIRQLLRVPAAVRFVSYEPALGQVDFSCWLPHGRCEEPLGEDEAACGTVQALPQMRRSAGGITHCPNCGSTAIKERERGIDWLIVGGESGIAARPFDLAWARTAVQQSKAAGVPVFVKQLGSRPIVHHASEWPGVRFDVAEQHVTLLDRKGGDMSEWPEDLRVREFPAISQGGQP